MNPRPRLPTKVSFKGGSPPRYPKPIFLSSLSESWGRDSFNGGSLSHPKNLECENKKIGTMLVCLELKKIHKELKLLGLFESVSLNKVFLNFQTKLILLLRFSNYKRV
jgi:hypothetical protein